MVCILQSEQFWARFWDWYLPGMQSWRNITNKQKKRSRAKQDEYMSQIMDDTRWKKNGKKCHILTKQNVNPIFEYFPAKQEGHPDAFTPVFWEANPGKHSLHVVDPEFSAYVPAGHFMQEVCPTTAWCCPAKHKGQSTDDNPTVADERPVAQFLHWELKDWLLHFPLAHGKPFEKLKQRNNINHQSRHPGQKKIRPEDKMKQTHKRKSEEMRK